MSTTQQEYETRRKEEEKRAKKFLKRLNGLRGSRKRENFDSDVFVERLTAFASETFETPEERFWYALPVLLKSLETREICLQYGTRNDALFSILDTWGLHNDSRATYSVMNYTVDHPDRYIHSVSEFVETFGEMAERFLPPQKRHIVFRKAAEIYVYLNDTEDTQEQAEALTTAAQKYIPRDRWPAAYDHLKHRCFRALTKPAYGERRIDTAQLTQAVKLLEKFANGLPLTPKKRESVFDDISGWLNEPEIHFPGIKILDCSLERDKSILLYEAKKALCPHRLCEEDYNRVWDCLADRENKKSLFFRNNSSRNQEKRLGKIDILTDCAEHCLPEETRKRVYAQDLMRIVESHSDDPIFCKYKDLVPEIIRAVRKIGPSDEQKAYVFDTMENMLTDSAIAGTLGDRDILPDLKHMSESLLNKEQHLSWLDRLTETPFFDPEVEEQSPFLSFLHQQFAKAADEKSGDVVSTRTVAANRINGKLYMAFSAATQNPLERTVLVYDGKKVEEEPEVRKRVTTASSVPVVRAENVRRFDDMVCAIR